MVCGVAKQLHARGTHSVNAQKRRLKVLSNNVCIVCVCTSVWRPWPTVWSTQTLICCVCASECSVSGHRGCQVQDHCIYKDQVTDKRCLYEEVYYSNNLGELCLQSAFYSAMKTENNSSTRKPAHFFFTKPPTVVYGHNMCAYRHCA